MHKNKLISVTSNFKDVERRPITGNVAGCSFRFLDHTNSKLETLRGA